MTATITSPHVSHPAPLSAEVYEGTDAPESFATP